jgi:hypothetical protein
MEGGDLSGRVCIHGGAAMLAQAVRSAFEISEDRAPVRAAAPRVIRPVLVHNPPA